MIGFHHVPVMIYTNSSPLCSKIPPKSLFLIDAKLILKERHLDPPKNQISSHLGELYRLVNVYKKQMGKSPCDFHGKINYFDWAMFISYVKLPEGNISRS
jgi:hypothetical protein